MDPRKGDEIGKGVVRSRIAASHVSTLESPGPVDVLPHMDRAFADVIRLRISRRDSYPGSPEWPDISTQEPVTGRQKAWRRLRCCSRRCRKGPGNLQKLGRARERILPESLPREPALPTPSERDVRRPGEMCDRPPDLGR